MQLRWIRAISFSCAVLVLGSCGGGGGADADAITKLSGTVAAGLPLVGGVTIKDSSLPAVQRTAEIDDEGHYQINIKGLQVPLMLRAEGDVGATHYVIFSAAPTVTDDTLNITPLTSLIVDNVAGQSAADYFDNGNFTTLTQAVLDAESAALKARLLPVLVAMNVSPDIDLLHTPFEPLTSPMDAALDVISISVDPDTHVATITNQVNQSVITDNIAVPASAEGNPPPLSGTGTSGAAGDIPKIRKVFEDFMFHFRDDHDAVRAEVLPLLTDTFLDNGKDRDGFFDIFNGGYVDENGNGRGYDGDSITDVVVRQIDYDNNGGLTPLALVDFTLLDDDHATVKGRVKNFTLLRGAGGVWRLHGNRSATLIPAISTALNVFSLLDVTSQCRSSGLYFTVREPEVNDNASIQFLNLVGLGLPPFEGAAPGNGMLWSARPAPGGEWRVTWFNTTWHAPLSWFPITYSCPGSWDHVVVPDNTIAAYPDNSVYTVRAWTTELTEIPLSKSNTGAYGREVNGFRTLTIPKRSLTLAELAITTQFPTLNTSTNFASYSGGSITISGTVANPAAKVWVYLGLTDGGNVVHSVDEEITASSNGSYSKTFSLANPGTITVREIRVASEDTFKRSFMSNIFLRQPPP